MEIVLLLALGWEDSAQDCRGCYRCTLSRHRTGDRVTWPDLAESNHNLLLVSPTPAEQRVRVDVWFVVAERELNTVTRGG